MMSGEWIKVRTNLWDDPRVMSICESAKCNEAAAIGGLYWLWATADEHSEDGIMPGLSTRGIDRKTGVPGLGAALVAIGWVADHPEGVRILRFDEHNGASAKARCQTAKRVATIRSNAPVTQPALQEHDEIVTGALAREDKNKRREEQEQKQEPKTTAAPEATQPAKAKSKVPPDGDLFPGIPAQLVSDFKALRAKKRAPITRTVMDVLTAEGVKAGMTLEAVLTVCCARGWQGFEAKWVAPDSPQQARASPSYKTANEKAKEFADRLTGKTRNEQRHDIIDINAAPSGKLG
jgi:hypothetical protein